MACSECHSHPYLFVELMCMWSYGRMSGKENGSSSLASWHEVTVYHIVKTELSHPLLV